MPPLPRSREGNESPSSHCHGSTMMGRRMSRQPEAGKPIHCRSSREGILLGSIVSPVAVLTFQLPNLKKGRFAYLLPACLARRPGMRPAGGAMHPGPAWRWAGKGFAGGAVAFPRSSKSTAVLRPEGDMMRPLKNGFAAVQKSFSLLILAKTILFNCQILNNILKRRKTFDSPLANHFSQLKLS